MAVVARKLSAGPLQSRSESLTCHLRHLQRWLLAWPVLAQQTRVVDMRSEAVVSEGRCCGCRTLSSACTQFHNLSSAEVLACHSRPCAMIVVHMRVPFVCSLHT